MATGEQGTFGESGERLTAAIENTPTDSRELLARVDFAPDTNAGMESMLGFRQDLGFAGSVQSMAAVAIHPEVESQNSTGVEEVAIRSSETLNLGEEFDGEVGSEQVFAGFGRNSSNTVIAALPFATVGWHQGDNVVRYRMATMMPAPQFADGSAPNDYLPCLPCGTGRWFSSKACVRKLDGSVRPTPPIWP